jgi:vacuolar protein sorting-associated protein 72
MSKSLAKNREKRLNAGSKMSQLLDAEEEDDFYKTTYGGFDDVFYHLFVFSI